MIVSVIKAGGGGFWAPIANPLADVLAFFYKYVPNYGVAIVLLTIVMMIVLTPLTIKQTRSMLVMQKLQPEMKKLQEQHKNDRQALNEAIMALYKEHNASPLGGCLPMLLPFPLFIALLKVLEGLSRVYHTGKGATAKTVSIPKYLTSHTKMYMDIVKAGGKLDAFGMDLAKSARSAGGGFAHSLPFFVLLLVMVGTQFYQQYQLTSKNPAIKSQPGQAMMMKLIPLVFGVISLAFPAGVVLYWTVSNIIRIGQQWALYRYDPKVKALVSKDVKEVEAKTREIDAEEAKAARPRFRDMLGSAAAGDRAGATGNGDTKPGARGTGDKAQAGGRGSGAQGVAKSRRPTGDAKAAGAQKATPQKGSGGKPGAVKPGAPRPAVAKGGAVKPGTAKPGATKAGGAVGTPRSGVARPAGSKAVPSKAVPSKGVASKAGPVKSGAPKAGLAKAEVAKAGTPKAATPKAVPAKPANDPASSEGSDATPATAPAATNGSPAVTVPAAASEPSNGTNGSGDETSGAPLTNGAAKASTNGVDDGADAVGAGSAPVKGRTGGGSAHTVSSRRRRKGR